MPYNGSGVFTPPASSFPAVANTLIESAKFNAVVTDVATGLSTALTKDGQTVATVAIPFDAGIKTDTVSENTSAAGVTVDGVLLKDGGATIKDSVTQFQDDADATKQMRFQLSGITTGNTRTLTVPDASTTLVGTDATQTLTNKTLGTTSASGVQKWAKGADVASANALTLGDDGNYFDITGTTAITSITTKAPGTVIKLHFDAILTLTHHATDLILPGAANITTAAGDEAEFIEYASGDWRCTNYTKASGRPVVGGVQTRQTFLSGSGTYTTPANARAINVRLAGAGGAGGGSGSGSPGAGAAGGDTTFSTLTAAGGGGGRASTATGIPTIPVGTNGDINISGGGAGAPSGTNGVRGGHGGNSAFGGGASAQTTDGGAGSAGGTNSGAGGAGGASTAANGGCGGGGASGAYVEKLIASPSATYAYSVGAAGVAGTAGTSGYAGGAGAAGVIIVDEYY